MSAHNPEIIFPCAFSKGYGIPAKQAWQLLKIYYIYRFILASSFVLLFRFRSGSTLLMGIHSGQLYAYSSIAYLVITFVLGFLVFWRLFSYGVLAELLIFSDIVLLTLLMYASGGTSSGVGVLPAISVAAGGLLVGGRCALVFAAIASVITLGAEIYALKTGYLAKANYTYVGTLGATYLAISLLSVVLARRSEQMLKLADDQQDTIIQLEELNRHIIQNMESGIIIADEREIVQMANQAALHLVKLAEMPEQIGEISSQLSTAFKDWLLLPENNLTILTINESTEIQCRFMALPTHHKILFMIMLEDMALYNQRLQQSKLASLGRLTASIAHEIRNPLGAISHAAQLLSESPVLTPQDIRLANIIESNSDRVNQIIKDILNLSRRTDSAREKVDLSHWLGEYLANFYVEATSDGSAFELKGPQKKLIAFIDPAHLKQIMDNLCQNALRYGQPEKGRILINLHLCNYGPCIEVIDNGPGISAEHRKQLFEPFFTTSTSGTGLGLYISKELAELNRAKLSYYLTDENRSCFSLCLQDANLNTIEL